MNISAPFRHLLLLYSASTESLEVLTSPSILNRELHLCKSQLNLLERWQLIHYKEADFLGWVARFILKWLPSSQDRLEHIDSLQNQLKASGLHVAPHRAICLPKGSTSSEISQTRRELPGVATANISSADKEIVLAAVKQYGFALQWAAAELKADKEIVLAAIENDGHALKYASDSLKADKKTVLTAVKQYGYALQFAADRLKADKEIVLVAVQQRGWALKWASNEIKADKEIVLAAVKQNSEALKFASVQLQLDPELIALAHS